MKISQEERGQVQMIPQEVLRNSDFFFHHFFKSFFLEKCVRLEPV